MVGLVFCPFSRSPSTVDEVSNEKSASQCRYHKVPIPQPHEVEIHLEQTYRQTDHHQECDKLRPVDYAVHGASVSMVGILALSGAHDNMTEASSNLALSRLADDLVGASSRLHDGPMLDELYTQIGIVRRSLMGTAPESPVDVLAVLACAYASLATLRTHQGDLVPESIDELAGEVQIAINTVARYIERSSPLTMLDLGLSPCHSTVWN